MMSSMMKKKKFFNFLLTTSVIRYACTRCDRYFEPKSLYVQNECPCGLSDCSEAATFSWSCNNCEEVNQSSTRYPREVYFCVKCSCGTDRKHLSIPKCKNVVETVMKSSLEVQKEIFQKLKETCSEKDEEQTRIEREEKAQMEKTPLQKAVLEYFYEKETQIEQARIEREEQQKRCSFLKKSILKHFYDRGATSEKDLIILSTLTSSKPRAPKECLVADFVANVTSSSIEMDQLETIAMLFKIK